MRKIQFFFGIFIVIFFGGCQVDTPTTLTLVPPDSGVEDSTVAPQQQARIPVLVMPGMFGSMSADLLEGKKKYVHAMESALAYVDKKFPGMLCGTKIPTQWKIDPIRCTYDTLIAALEDANHLVWTFPYDWRDAPDTLAPYLDAQVRALAAYSDDGTIAVVAHSYGGLVLRACMQQGLCAAVRKAVFVGTPHHGTVEAYYLYGGEATGSAGEVMLKEALLSVMKWAQIGTDVSALFNGNIGTGPSVFDYRYVQTYMPSVGKLTPVFDYIRRWNVLTKTATPVAYTELCRHNVWLENLNANASALFAQGAEVLNIVGTDTPTTKEILVRDLGVVPCKARTRWPNGDPQSVLLLNAPQRNWKVDGDGVVTQASAAFPAGSGTVQHVRNTKKHRKLVMNKEVHERIAEFLDN